MTNYVYIATSLDGYIAGPNNDLSWLNEIPNPENSDYGFAEFMDKIDALVMGRHTYEAVLSFGEWPYTKPVFVLSNSLESVPEEYKSKAEIIRGEPSDIVKQLQDRGYKNLYIDGGKVIQDFLETDLIDEMVISIVPFLLGEGIPLFGKLSKRLDFKHLKTESLNEKLVKNYYQRDRK